MVRKNEDPQELQFETKEEAKRKMVELPIWSNSLDPYVSNMPFNKAAPLIEQASANKAGVLGSASTRGISPSVSSTQNTLCDGSW